MLCTKILNVQEAKKKKHACYSNLYDIVYRVAMQGNIAPPTYVSFSLCSCLYHYSPLTFIVG